MMFRDVTHEDGERIARLMASVFAEYPGCVFEPSEFPELRHITEYVTRVNGRMWVVEDSGEVAACVGLRGVTPPKFELVKLYVSRAHRRRGLGARLVALAEAEARARGGQSMMLFSDTRFLDAHRLYERLGYERTGEEIELDDVSNTREYGFQKRL